MTPTPLQSPTWRGQLLGLLAVAFLFLGCDATSSGGDADRNPNCVESADLREGAERGSITALTDPPVLDANKVKNLEDTDRVLALLVGSTPLAVPRKLLNQHEIVNLNSWVSKPITVTHCPLTKSSLAFDRSTVEGAEFGVSGLLLHDNLVMLDKRGNESLWPQMGRSAICGPASGQTLDMVPIIDLQWGYWRKLHPNTKVLPVSVAEEQSGLSSQDDASPRRSGLAVEKTSAPSGLVLGIPGTSISGGAPKNGGTGGVALPFRSLNNGRPARAVKVGGETGPVVFWNQEARGAMAFEASAAFSANENGRFVDEETGSVWRLDGRAIEGPRAGEQLPPVATAYVALWEAWSAFHPDTDAWGESTSS